jgi:hypothetical protein
LAGAWFGTVALVFCTLTAAEAEAVGPVKELFPWLSDASGVFVDVFVLFMIQEVDSNTEMSVRINAHADWYDPVWQHEQYCG